MSDEKIVHVINKRNRAVFAVPLKEAQELMANFNDILETKEELPTKPEPAANSDELKILGGSEESQKKEEPVEEKAAINVQPAPETKEELPTKPEPAASKKPAETKN